MIASFPIVVGRAWVPERLHEPVPSGIEEMGFHKGPESQDRLAALKAHPIPHLISRSCRNIRFTPNLARPAGAVARNSGECLAGGSSHTSGQTG